MVRNMHRNYLYIACSILAVLFATEIHGQALILTNDKQLNDLATDPDKKIDNTTGLNKSFISLRETVTSHTRSGSKILAIAFDEFFRQYRDDADTVRNLTPDMDEYIDKMSSISHFVEKEGNGMSLMLSLLSPLELGKAYRNQTGNTGHWVAYKAGTRNAKTGKFSLQMWQQQKWCNNKGVTPVELVDVHAYAFRSSAVSANQYAVSSNDIIPLKNVHYEVMDNISNMRKIRVFGEEEITPEYDQVFVVLHFDTQEMDYFADNALPFLKNLLKKYYDKGIRIGALYCDEMHIQQDWSYFSHHEEGCFNMRYLTTNMEKHLAQVTGLPFDERYLLYFVQQPCTYSERVDATIEKEYVMGNSIKEIHETYLLRERYFRMLQNEVVELFCKAKDYATQLFGHDFETKAHSSWAESPTIDYWQQAHFGYSTNYEYTPNFVWSNTVHQAASACYDYFKWGEYLQPTGNDFAECGWSDRNYYGAAMAASLAVINKIPTAYAAAWGMPNEALERRMAINYAFGCEVPYPMSLATGNVTRDIDILVLYPMNLVAVNQRFGSWMTQYGYANYLTSDQLLKHGVTTSDGYMQVCKKRYGTIVVPFEPLPESRLIPLLLDFVNKGGKVVWCSLPPYINKKGDNCQKEWEELFGIQYKQIPELGREASGHRITFQGTMKQVPEQQILSDLFVDFVYPVEPKTQTEIVAKIGEEVVGTIQRHPNGGIACYCGFRPRDDQSHSLGYESRTFFELLDALGSYPPTGKFKNVNDNPSYVSRHTPYFSTTFPNGTTMVVNHYRTHAETWVGGFSRDMKADAEALKENPLPSDTLQLKNLYVNGHQITYNGRLTMGFNVKDGLLTTFCGQQCTGIEADGKEYTFSEKPIKQLTFAAVEGEPMHYILVTNGVKELTIPIPSKSRKATILCNNDTIRHTLKKGCLRLQLEERHYNRTIQIQLENAAR